MNTKERAKLWGRLTGTILIDNFPLVVEEIDRAVRKAKRAERKRLMTCQSCGRDCSGAMSSCEGCNPL